MTDRYNALIVVLDRDTRDDDCKAIIDAIRMIKGVLSVTGNKRDPDDYVAKERERKWWSDRLIDLLNEKAING